MTEFTSALPLPRARTLVHPGPVGPIRIEHRHANLGRHFRLALAPGRTLQDAIIEPLLRAAASRLRVDDDPRRAGCRTTALLRRAARPRPG